MKKTRLAVCILAIVLLSCACGEKTEPAPVLEVICLDVGQGNSTLLRTGNGDVLIDAGPEAAQEALVRRLRALNVESFSLVVFTHPDEDHIGGADGVLRAFPAERVWVNGAEDRNESRDRLEEAMRGSGIVPETVGAGDAAQLGDAVLTVLFPTRGQAESENEGSLVLRLECGAFSMLVMGDSGEAAEQWMLEQYDESLLKADLLHVGHHGSNGSSSAAFLSAVEPECAVISCGAANSYGHPDGRALARLQAIGAAVYRTDLMGEIRVSTDGKCYTVAGESGENDGARETAVITLLKTGKDGMYP